MTLTRLAAATGLATCMVPMTAHALALPESIAPATDKAAFCRAEQSGSVQIASIEGGASGSKSAAILGGQPSALDLIRQQQAELIVSEPAHDVSTHIDPSSNCPPVPAFAEPRFAMQEPTGAAPGEFMGTARIGIGHTPFDADWRRVSAQTLSIARAVDASGDAASGAEMLAAVNGWANSRIEYVEDVSNYGARDYWATASETLSRGKGDCEDYAILKYQILAALGVERSAMYLTLARDLVRNADHAVLVVRLDGQHWILDNATDALIPANVSHDYRPTLSFNTESAWLHGAVRRPELTVQQPAGTLAYLSESALSNARVTGFSR